MLLLQLNVIIGEQQNLTFICYKICSNISVFSVNTIVRVTSYFFLFIFFYLYHASDLLNLVSCFIVSDSSVCSILSKKNKKIKIV